jgi:hypothetical protein
MAVVIIGTERPAFRAASTARGRSDRPSVDLLGRLQPDLPELLAVYDLFGDPALMTR